MCIESSAVGKQSPGRTSQAERSASPADVSLNQEEAGGQANRTVSQEEDDEIASDADICQEPEAVDSLKDSARKKPTRKKIVRQQVSYCTNPCVSPFVIDIGNRVRWVTTYVTKQ